MTTQTTAAPLVVDRTDSRWTLKPGRLARVRNPSSAFHGMTGTVVAHAMFGEHCWEIRMTSTGTVLTFSAYELIDEWLARVPDAAGSK